MGFRRLRPQFCSIYDGYFWRHERLWKLLVVPRFNGTPFKPLMWRLLGVKVGKRLYDAGATIPEKTLVTIGDDCTFNEGATIQGHSMEDGTFKSDYVVIGDRCSLGVDVWINYGATLHTGSTLRADALLMKGEDVPEGTSYVGNPAREIVVPASREPHPAPLPAGPRHRALTDSAGRRMKSSRASHGAHAPRRHKAVSI